MSFVPVYREDVNAPQRHHNRHKPKEPEARPLRVGDTEKPGPEGKRRIHTTASTTTSHLDHSTYTNILLERSHS